MSDEKENRYRVLEQEQKKEWEDAEKLKLGFGLFIFGLAFFFWIGFGLWNGFELAFWLLSILVFGAATWITFFFNSGIDEALKKDGTFAKKLQVFLGTWLVGLFILGLIALVAINVDGTPSEYK